MCHQPLLTCSLGWCEGGQRAHSWSHSPTSTCREHKVPAENIRYKAFTQTVQGNNKLHFIVKDFYLPWCYGELIEELISPHNTSLMKRNRMPGKRGHPFRKAIVLRLLWTGTVKNKSGASVALKTTQVDKTWWGKWSWGEAPCQGSGGGGLPAASAASQLGSHSISLR